MTPWLLTRLFDAKDQPTPRFAFQGTINWMRALAILVENGSFEASQIKAHYKFVNRRHPNSEADTLAFENMMMAFHNQASLVRMTKDATHPYDVCRSAIINWYYSTYFSSSAMIAATSGSKQETHANTAKVWQAEVVEKEMVLLPFSLNLKNLVKSDVESDILTYRNGNTNDLNTYPENTDEAWGAVVSYLKGTWAYEKWRVEERVKCSKEYKSLGVSDFRTKQARNLRDSQLKKNSVNYLTQAFRYRGKANYRDSIFLSYGDNNSEKIELFVKDLEKVSRAFQRMAAYYISCRVEKGTWFSFIKDLGENSRLSIDVQYLSI